MRQARVQHWTLERHQSSGELGQGLLHCLHGCHGGWRDGSPPWWLPHAGPRAWPGGEPCAVRHAVRCAAPLMSIALGAVVAESVMKACISSPLTSGSRFSPLSTFVGACTTFDYTYPGCAVGESRCRPPASRSGALVTDGENKSEGLVNLGGRDRIDLGQGRWLASQAILSSLHHPFALLHYLESSPDELAIRAT